MAKKRKTRRPAGYNPVSSLFKTAGSGQLYRPNYRVESDQLFEVIQQEGSAARVLDTEEVIRPDSDSQCEFGDVGNLDVLQHPEGIGGSVLLDEWLRLHTPRATVATRNPKKGETVGKRRHLGGLPHLRKAVAWGEPLASVSEGFRAVSIKDYSSALNKSNLSRYFSESGNGNIADMRNKKAQEYVLKSFEQSAKVKTDIANVKFMLWRTEEDKRAKSHESSRSTYFERLSDVQAIAAASSVDVTGVPWDIEAEPITVEDVTKIIDRKIVTDPEHITTEQVVEESPPDVANDISNNLRMMKFHMSQALKNPMALQYHSELYSKHKKEYVDNCMFVFMHKSVKYHYELAAIRSANLHKVAQVRESLRKKREGSVSSVVPELTSSALSLIYKQVVDQCDLAKREAKHIRDKSLVSLFGIKYGQTEAGLLLPVAMDEGPCSESIFWGNIR